MGGNYDVGFKIFEKQEHEGNNMQIGMECDNVDSVGRGTRSKERILHNIVWEVRARIMAKGRFKKKNENLEICSGWGLPDKNSLKIGE